MRRIIGLDMGHCEIAAATPNYTGGSFAGMCNLFLDGNKNTVILSEVEYQEELFNYFKASPGHFDEVIQGNKKGNAIRRRDLLSMLFSRIMQNIKDYNTNISERDQILLLVGCPTSEEWTSSKNRRAYQALIQKATGAAEVRIVPESRAAMFSALADGKGRMISASDGASVYDFGSSTTDMTHMKTGEKYVELSWNFGAREIEKSMRKLMCRKAEEEAGQKGVHLMMQQNFSDLERKLREMKEAYFNGSLTADSCTVAWKFPVQEGGKLTVTLDIDNSTMREALKEEVAIDINRRLIAGSWKEYCKQFFLESKAKIENANHSSREIVLTGGASKMSFVAAYAREVFPEPAYTITCSRTPCFSVSQGLVWVGLVDELERECIDAVEKAVIDSGACSADKLKGMLRENMGESMYQIVMEACTEWANATEDESLKRLEERMQEKVSRKMADIKAGNKVCVSKWSKEILQAVRRQLESEIQKKLGASMAQKIKMPEGKWDALDSSLNNVSIDTASIIAAIDVNSILDNVIMVAVALAYAILGNILFPGVGGVIGFLVGVVMARLFHDTDKEKKREAKVRNNTRDKMKDKKDVIYEMCGEELDKILDSVLSDSNVEHNIRAIVKDAYEIMTLKCVI
ncbi:MAG: hypothetical protein J6A08_13580 [Lachnospiraceae bacterium]|nr:hypothetical protein [Lachnospiraceae bacterium]